MDSDDDLKKSFNLICFAKVELSTIFKYYHYDICCYYYDGQGGSVAFIVFTVCSI